MSATKRGKHKQQAEVSEEEDFETFVRESLGQLSKGQKQIIQDISNLKAKVKLNETESSSTSGSITIEIADHLSVFTLSYDPTLSSFPIKLKLEILKGLIRLLFKKHWGMLIGHQYTRAMM